MNRLTLLGIVSVMNVLMASTALSNNIRPAGFNSGEERWQVLGRYSDEFNSKKLNSAIWDSAPKSLIVGAWTFDKDNAFVADGKLNIQVTQETHTRKFPDVCQGGKQTDRTLYYKSGAVRTRADTVYGFYEAKIKGVQVFPGLSPAFWLYSDGHPFSDRQVAGSVDYSEIDIVELQQADWHGPKPDDADAINITDHNLHARIVGDNGRLIWRRPKPYPEAQQLRYDAPFDPSAEFHTYAVENRKDKISWYVDGKLIGEKPNLFWHRPMHLIFSMGLRRQFIKYNAKCQRADPSDANVVSEGFPEQATMQIDYVKTWQALPSVWLENSSQLQTSQFQAGQSLAITLKYHGGSNDHVVANIENNGKQQGLSVRLIEKNEQGFVQTVAEIDDESVLDDSKKYGGEVKLLLPLTNVIPSKKLPAGHYYALIALFKSSNGKTIFLQKSINNITVTEL